MSALPEESVVSSIVVRSGKGGPCRVFIIQTRNHSEVIHVQQLFSEIEHFCSVRALAAGVTTAFAVQPSGEVSLVDEAEALLKEHFKFSVVYAGFNPVIHRIVEDLAMETGSRLFPIPVCQSCGESSPFPTQVTVQGRNGKAQAKGILCDHCVAIAGGEREAEGLCRLVDMGRTDLKAGSDTPVVRKRSLLRHGFGRRASAKTGTKSTRKPAMSGTPEEPEAELLAS